MIDIKLQFQAALFQDINDFVPNAKNITDVVNAFQDYELLPNTLQEVGGDGVTNRIGLKSQNGDLNVKFHRNRIDIERIPINSESDEEQNIESFCNELTKMLSHLYDITQKKSTRLALHSQYFLKEMDEEELDRIFETIFNPTKFYKDNSPNQWNNRQSSIVENKLGDNIEKFNFITELNRVQGSYNRKGNLNKFDRLQIKTDLNTHQGKTDARFGLEETIEFFKFVVEKEIYLKNELIEFINA